MNNESKMWLIKLQLSNLIKLKQEEKAQKDSTEGDQVLDKQQKRSSGGMHMLTGNMS